LHIEPMVISHYRYNSQTQELVPLGGLGTPSTSVRLDDEVRARVRINRPAYCYLIAFNADGGEQLCYPSDRTTPPALNDGFDYPAVPTRYFKLNDGIGLQVFVLLASREPLPCYEEWKARAGTAPWQAAVRANGLWHFDGREFVRGPRGAEVERPTLEHLPKPFADLCHFLSERPGVDAIDAVAFPVEPNG
jgi:hypothetical protein